MTSNLSEEVRQPIRVPTEIPNEWTWGGLSELCRPKQWPTISKDQLLPDGYVVYGANGPIGFYSEYTHAERTIAITCRGATCGTVNVAPAKSYITGNAMALDDPDRTRVHFDYLYQALVYRGLSDVISGSAQPQITRQGLAPVLIPLPPLPEQRKIAAILSSVDDAIEATQAVIDQLHVVKKAMMAELLTRGLPGRHTRFKQTEIGEVPEGWEVKTLPEVASFQNGKAFPSSDYTVQGVRLVRPGNLGPNGMVVWDSKHTTFLPEKHATANPSFLVRSSELLMNLTAQSLDDEFLGRVCVTPVGTICLLNQRIARIVPQKIESRYLHWALMGPQFRAHIDRIPKGSKVQHIYNGDLASARLPVPSQDEQLRIANMLDLVRDRIEEEEPFHRALHSIKSALSSALLTGEIRVKPDEAIP